jgi:hypothetical protein
MNTWLETLRRNVTLTFHTVDDDKIILKLEDIENIKLFYQDYFFLFNTKYIKKNNAFMDNQFHEYISLLLHELYHQYNFELYELFNNTPVYTIYTTDNSDEEEYHYNIKVIYNKTNEPVTSGKLAVYLNDELKQINDIQELNQLYQDNQYPFSETIKCSDETIKIVYIDKNNKETIKEINLLEELPELNITVDDITGVQGEEVTLTANVKDENENPLQEGEINFNINI